MTNGSAATMPARSASITDGMRVDSRALPRSPLFSFEKFSQSYDAGLSAKWQVELLTKICSLLQLRDNWDGYRTLSPRRDAGMFALEVLHQAMRPRTPLPQVVPSSDGGIQLEWHERGIDLELHVTTPYHCELWFEDHRSGQEPLSLELTDNFSTFQAAIATLTSR